VFEIFGLADVVRFTDCVYFMQLASLYFDKNSDGKIYIERAVGISKCCRTISILTTALHGGK
jgi:hypothetical protein